MSSSRQRKWKKQVCNWFWAVDAFASSPRRTQKWRPHNKMWAKHVNPCRTQARPTHALELKDMWKNGKTKKTPETTIAVKKLNQIPAAKPTQVTKTKKLKATSLAKTTKAGTEMLQSFKARKTKATQAIKSHRGFKTWSERKPHKPQKLQKQRKTLRDTQIQAWKNMPET